MAEIPPDGSSRRAKHTLTTFAEKYYKRNGVGIGDPEELDQFEWDIEIEMARMEGQHTLTHLIADEMIGDPVDDFNDSQF